MTKYIENNIIFHSVKIYKDVMNLFYIFLLQLVVIYFFLTALNKENL